MTRDTIAALATPAGAGAVALVRVCGPAAWKAVSGFLDLAGPPEPRRQTLAWAVDGNRRLDRLMVTLFPAGASYTGEETVELSCHGSPFIVERLLGLLRAGGARDAAPGEFTQRAFLSGRIDLTQAEAVCELIASRGESEHRAAVAALEGGLSRRVGALTEKARALAALVEANLDHPDEDIPPVEPAAAAAEALALAEETGRTAAARRRGRPAETPRVVLLGAPNAGKSSLLNALLGADRALVSDEPGTTRDSVWAPAVLGTVSCCVVDTAGLRAAPAGAVEAMGQEKARSEARTADLAVLVIDRTAPPEQARRLAAEALALTSRDRLAVALNKTDLPGSVTGPAHLDGLEAVCVSALSGEGVAELARLAGRRLGAVEPGTFSVTERQGAALDRAREAFVESSLELRAGREEIAARALRAALAALDSVVGKDTAEETLAAVFSRFCVGK